MAMQLFGIGKTPLHHFLSSPVDFFTLLRVAMLVDPVFTVLPDVTGNYFDEVGRTGALGLEGTGPASGRA